MKNKFKVGDKVIYISDYQDSGFRKISNETIERLDIHKAFIEYRSLAGNNHMIEKNLYTKEEAIEFLKGVL
jgi:hypothetical protein